MNLPDPPKIIGLVGRSRCGKDSTAEYIKNIYQSQCNYSIVRLSSPVKEAARILYDFNWEQLEGNKKEIIDERWNITPRSVFQKITTDVMTTSGLGVMHFTNLLYNNYEKGVYGDYIIIPDIRYLHDIDEIYKHGGKVLYIQRDNLPIKYDCENHLDMLDNRNLPTIRNNGMDIKQLHTEILSAIQLTF